MKHKTLRMNLSRKWVSQNEKFVNMERTHSPIFSIYDFNRIASMLSLAEDVVRSRRPNLRITCIIGEDLEIGMIQVTKSQNGKHVVLWKREIEPGAVLRLALRDLKIDAIGFMTNTGSLYSKREINFVEHESYSKSLVERYLSENGIIFQESWMNR